MFQPRTQGAIQNGNAIKAQCVEADRGDNTCASVNPPKVAGAMLDELDGIIHRMMSISDRQEVICDRMFGERDAGKEDCGQPQPPGIVGVMANKLNMIRKIIDALETNTYRIEQLV